MSYLQFLLVFLVAPSALLLALHGHERLRDTALLIGILAVIALAFGVPLQIALTQLDVWSGDGRGLGGVVFFALVPVFTGTLAVVVLRRRWWSH